MPSLLSVIRMTVSVKRILFASMGLGKQKLKGKERKTRLGGCTKKGRAKILVEFYGKYGVRR